MQEHAYTLIHPFDDPYIIAGQGTIGLEIVEALPDVDMVLVPLSGGGLISGIALTIKAINPKIRVIGVSMESACVMYQSLQAGKPIELPEEDTLADSLLGGIGLNNQFTFSIVRDYVDDVILVSEEEIAEAMAFALHEEHLVLEGAGAVGVAAVLNRHIKPRGSVVSICSGGNVDIPTLLGIAQKYRS
jgi:threonine dehydratase